MDYLKNDEIPYLFVGYILLFVAYLVFFPVLQHSWALSDGVYDYKRIGNIVIILACLLPILFFAHPQKKVFKIWQSFTFNIRISFGVLLGLGIASTITADYPTWALLEVSHLTLLFLLVLSIAAIVQQYPVLMKQLLLLAVVSLASFYLAKVTIGYYRYETRLFYPIWPGWGGFTGLYGFSNIRIFNHIQTITLPLLGVVVLYGRRFNKMAFLASFVFLSGWWMLVFASGARGTTLGASTGIIAAGFIIHPIVLRWLKVQFIAAIVGVFGYYFLFVNLVEKASRTVVRGGSPRIEMWQKAIIEIFQHPWLGVGPMHFAAVELDKNPAGPHNYAIAMAYEWGLPAAILFVTVIGYGLYCFYQNTKTTSYSPNDQFKILFRVGLLASLFAASIHGVFAGLLRAPMSQIWLVIIIGYAIGFYYGDKEQKNTGRYTYNWNFATFILVCLTTFLITVYPSATNFKERQKEYIEQYGPGNLAPRFWQQGKIGWEKADPGKKETGIRN